MKLKLSDREKWLILLILLIGIFYFVLNFLYMPHIFSINTLRQKITSETQKLKTYEEKDRILKNIELAPLEKLRGSKTKEEQTIEALRYIAQLISSLKLDLISIKPRLEEKSIDSAKVMFFDITYIGDYISIYKFTKALVDLPILILIDSMQIKRDENNKSKVSMLLSVYY